MTSAPGGGVPEGASTPARVAVAINPQASSGRRREVGPAVVRALQTEGREVVVLAQPNYELLRRETVRVIEDGVDALVVVGGDGMVSLGVNILAQTSVPLGIVASGTGNDMARSLGLPVGDTDASIVALLDAVSRGPRRIDLGRVRHGALSTWFACVLSAGFDAMVNERANRMVRPRGRHRYTIAMARELLTFRAARYRLTIDGVITTPEAMLVSVANGRSIGGGMMIAPGAELDDGLLDVFVADRMPRHRFLRVFPRVFRGEHTALAEVHTTRARSVVIEAGGIVAYADGERIGALPVEVSAVPGALLVYA